MVGEAYGWVNSHKSNWVGLLLAEEQLLYYLVSRLGRTFSGSIDLGMLGMRGVVLRPSLFTYSYDLPQGFPMAVCLDLALVRSHNTETILCMWRS